MDAGFVDRTGISVKDSIIQYQGSLLQNIGLMNRFLIAGNG